MAGLLNRWREFVVDGRPVATGFIPIGDAVLCTNPLYGRGCATAFWGAHLMVDAIDAHPSDPEAMLLAYDAALRAEIYPWYRARSSRTPKRGGRRRAAWPARIPTAIHRISAASCAPCSATGCCPALRRDPVVLRAFFRAAQPADRTRAR